MKYGIYLITGLLLLLTGCGEEKLIERDFTVLGIEFVLQIPQGEMSSLQAMKLTDKAEKVVETRLGLLLGKESELAGIQKSEGVISVSPELYYILERAMYVYTRSDSVWNPLLGAVEELWRSKEHNDAMAEVSGLMDAVRASTLTVKGSGVVEKKGTAVIALRRMVVGYALDGAVQALKDGGLESGMVSALDMTAFWGRKSKKEGWTFVIDFPSSGDTTYYKFTPPNGTFCKIDDTEKKPPKGSPILLQPDNGFPYETKAVTLVWNPSAMMAGAWAEAGSLKGRKDLFYMVRNSPPDDSIGVLFLYPDGEQYLLETDLILSEAVSFETIEPEED